MTTLYARLRLRTLQTVAIRGGSAAFAVLLSYLLVKLGSAERLGTFSVALVTVQLSAALSLFGMNSMLLRLSLRAFARGQPRSIATFRAEAFAITLALSAASACICALAGLALSLSATRFEPIGHSLLLMALFIPLSCLCQLASSILQSEGSDAKSQIVYVTLPSIVAASALGIGALLDANLADAVEILYVAGGLLSYVISRAWVRISLRQSIRLSLTLFRSRRLRFIRLSAPVQFANIGNYLSEWISTIVLAMAAPLAAVGAMRVINQVGSLFLLISTGFELPLSSAIATAHFRGDDDRVRRLIKKSKIFMFLASLPLGLLLILFSRQFLSVFEVYSVTAQAGLIIVVSAFLIKSLTGAAGSALNVLNGTRELLKASYGALFVSAALVSILTPLFGLLGAAVSTSLALVFRSILNQWYVIKIIRRVRR